MKASFLVSSFLHLALFFWVFFIAPKLPNSTPSQDTKNSLQVRTLSQKAFQSEVAKALEKDEIQIVQTDDRLKSEQAPDTSEKVFLSKHNQSVDKNTRAASIGKFRNNLRDGESAPSSPQKTANSNTKSSSSVSKLFKIGAGDNESASKTSETQSTGRLYNPTNRAPAAIHSGEGPSQTDDYLKDIAIGTQTLLNAKEYKFYSFYERVRQRLTEQWNLELRAQIERILKNGAGLGGIDRVTKVLVYLDKNGHIQSTKLLATSGMDELDHAATEAFRISAPFPNPPKDMVGENDLVPLRWDFIVVSTAADGIDIQIRREKFEGY